METIVVGYDGSEGARGAVEFAAHEAAFRRATLRVVTAWDLPYTVFSGGLMPPVNLTDTIREDAEATAQAGADIVEQLEPEVYCEHVAIEGHPADVLLSQSQGATALVVGSRGHGGFASLLLGSVSHQVVQHATCPVVVVRAGAAAA